MRQTLPFAKPLSFHIKTALATGVALLLHAGCQQSPAGEPGAMGTMGTEGARGQTGEKGEKGEKGDKGEPGAAGPTGVMGAPGAKGDKGDKGDQGLQGPAGAQGVQGPQGMQGSAGTTGATGATGLPGPKGDPGSPGAPGAPGSSGAYTEDGAAFVGFTTTTYTGLIPTGRPGAHAACAAAFAGSHLCHVAEYALSNSPIDPPATGAWIDPSAEFDSSTSYNGSPQAGRSPNGYACLSYGHSGTSYGGTSISASGSIGWTTDCDKAKSLACCSTPSKTRFAGFTTKTTTGKLGGRAKAHALCNSEFSGAHYCHAAEYLRANSATTIPASGVWIDPSGNNSGVVYVGLPTLGRQIGGYTCLTYTHDGTSYGGTSLKASGSIGWTTDCDKAKPLACCY